MVPSPRRLPVALVAAALATLVATAGCKARKEAAAVKDGEATEGAPAAAAGDDVDAIIARIAVDAGQVESSAQSYVAAAGLTAYLSVPGAEPRDQTALALAEPAAKTPAQELAEAQQSLTATSQRLETATVALRDLAKNDNATQAEMRTLVQQTTALGDEVKRLTLQIERLTAAQATAAATAADVSEARVEQAVQARLRVLQQQAEERRLAEEKKKADDAEKARKAVKMKLALIPHGFRKLLDSYAWLLGLKGVTSADVDFSAKIYVVETTVGAWQGGLRDTLIKSGVFDDTGRGIFDHAEFVRAGMDKWKPKNLSFYYVPDHRQSATNAGCYVLDLAASGKQIQDNVSGVYIISYKHDYARSSASVDWDDVKRRYPCLYSFGDYDVNAH